eukprot:1469801-Amphidinium_carterae.1
MVSLLDSSSMHPGAAAHRCGQSLHTRHRECAPAARLSSLQGHFIIEVLESKVSARLEIRSDRIFAFPSCSKVGWCLFKQWRTDM